MTNVKVVKAEWVSKPTWSEFGSKLLDLESCLGKTNFDSIHMTRWFEYPWVYDTLGPFNPEDVVLDAGPGNTALQFLISKQVKEVHSLDLCQEYVDWTTKTKDERGFTNLFPRFGDILASPYPNDYFDKVICISVLEHIRKDKVSQAMTELVRMVKPNGKMVITMDVAYGQTDNQVTMTDFEQIMDGQFRAPSSETSVFSVDGIQFSVICMLLGKV